MPFEGKTVEMKREEFVKECLSKQKSKSALCLKYGISRPTGDKWIKRYLSGESMSDKSKAPFNTPSKISSEMEDKIVAQRTMEPAVGAIKIERMLKNQGYKNVPCYSTINAVLKRNNLITKEASEAATPYKRFEKQSPNIMWQADFKGHYQLRNNIRCHPLSVLDDHSRFNLCADALDNEQMSDTKSCFIRTFKQYGLPESLLCDNGNPWGTSQSTGYTLFEVWLMNLGILPIHIRAKHPQTQGKVERFNGSFKRERLNYYVPSNMADAQKQRLEYQNFYNYDRPHHALDLDVPADHFVRSNREYFDVFTEWEYEPECVIHKIKRSGYLTYKGQGYFLSEAFGGLSVALRPSSSVDGLVHLFYRQFKIAELNIANRCFSSRKIYLISGDPRTKIQL